MNATTLESFINYIFKKEDNIILFGASEFGKKVARTLLNSNINVKYFSDNDRMKHNQYFEGLLIINPKEIRKEDVVIITSMYYREIDVQLKEQGIRNIYYIEENKGINYRDVWGKEYSNQIDIGENTTLTNTFNLRIENTETRKYVRIGDHSLLACSINCYDTGSIIIGDRSYVAAGTNLISKKSIDIGNDVLISWGCTIYDNDGHSTAWQERKYDVQVMVDYYYKHGIITKDRYWENVPSAKIIIEDKVWIGFGVTILKGVVIGEGAVIGCNSVVTNDIPSYSVAAGNPAKVIKLIKI